MGIGVLARDDALDLVCGRHAPRPLRGDPASSVRRRERDGIGIVNLPRSSGVLLHVTSLPGGRLGTHAFAFVDWLAAAGQTWWQVLPLAPPDRSGSPYTSTSAFAGWPGLLADPAAAGERRRDRRLPRARTRYWIGDWERFAGEGAVADQVRFEREWSALRRYARERGVRLIGDIPLYVGAGSADHRAHPELFQRGFVAGAPPDALGSAGQLWGNPLYDWPALRRAGLPLVDRAAAARVRAGRPRAHRPLPRLRRVLVGPRAGARTRATGRWRRGPGRRGVRRRAARARASCR